MKWSLIAILGLIACTAIVAAGCMQPARSLPAVPVETRPAPSVSSTGPVTAVAYSIVPEPTDTMPEDEMVSVQVNRNPITEDPTITAIFNGGLGSDITQSMNLTVIRADGIYETDSVRHPDMGSSLTLKGTTKSDRVIVEVTMDSGKIYRVYDQLVPFTKL